MDDGDEPVPYVMDEGVLLPLLFPPPLPADDDATAGVSPSWVYLEDRAYVSPDAVSNSTTAFSTTTTGVSIHVSFCLARPPRLSYLCVHCPRPGDGEGAYRFTVDPRVLGTHTDVALLRVPHPNDGLHRGIKSYDYFVYTARPGPGASLLRLLPNPRVSPFRNEEVAIVRCSGGARYVIACLMPTIRRPMEFKVMRFDSDVGRWKSTAVSISEPVERDRVLPIPDTASQMVFHCTTKVITLGGTIGWVDLWRGILLCDDVLDQHLVLRDVPLPKPARSNRKSFCRGPPHHYRDITVVVQDSVPTCIKYVEMVTRPGDRPPPRQRQPPQHSDDSDSDEEEDVAYYWKANIWSMPIPVGSWEDWQMECTVDVTDIAVDNVRFSELLPKIGNDPEETLRRLVTGFPTLGMDGDVISFLSKINRLDDKGWVISVDLRSKTLQGVAELDERKNFLFKRYYNTSEISKYLIKATGEAGTLVKTGPIPLDDDLLLPLLFSPPLPADDDDGGGVSPTPSWVYLDASAYVSPDAVSNATTAVSTTTTGVRIHVSFCLARPPRLSYLCVHCPRPGAGHGEAYRFTVDPRVISTHADVALLLVPHPNDELYRGIRSYDYFVYTASPRPSLRLLPNPHASPFSSDAVAIVRCSGGARYVIAGLMPTIRCPMEFKLQRFDSDVGRWTSTAVSVDEPAERDRVLPIPDTATEVLFHYTTKVITLAGGEHAMAVGWVDLWRGILLCDDVLDEHPVLRDLPLPKPARRNRKSFCIGYPHGYRDITVVVQDSAATCIKYVEMILLTTDEDAPVIPAGSWKDWHRECTVDVTDIAVVDNVRFSELLPKIGNDPEETLRLLTGHPTLGMDGNVISFLSKIGYSDDKGWVISVDLRDKTLQGVTELDHRKNSSFMRYYITSEISKYLINATGTLVRTGAMESNKKRKKKKKSRRLPGGKR
uniref:DUF1618 domain-containing protein n=1 Tax=Oryza rufipogon TaxID=4529 RepID=A0A0E0N8T2_ORYRU